MIVNCSHVRDFYILDQRYLSVCLPVYPSAWSVLSVCLLIYLSSTPISGKHILETDMNISKPITGYVCARAQSST